MSLSVFTLVAALGTASCCGQVSFRGSEPGDPPARLPSAMAPARYGRTVLALVRDGLWSALAAEGLHTLTSDWPGWFPPALALFWTFRLLAAAVTLDVAAHREEVQRSRAVGLLTRPLWLLTFWTAGLSLAIAVAMFWVIVFVGLLRR